MTTAYFVTGCIAALVLFSIDKFPPFQEPPITIKRLIVMAMPVSIGAIVVDGLNY